MRWFVCWFVGLVLMVPVCVSAGPRDFNLRVGDTGPYYYAQIVDQNGDAVDITGATVTFSMRSMTGTAKVSGSAMEISTASSGEIEYRWDAADTDWAATFAVQIQMTLGGLTYSFPTSGVAKVIISDLFSF